MWRKRNPHILLVVIQTGAAMVESSMVVPQNIKNKITLLGLYSKIMKTVIQKDMCNLMFIVALFTIDKLWKQPKCPLTDQWIKKMWYVYIHIYIYVCVCVCIYIYMCVCVCVYIYVCVCVCVCTYIHTLFLLYPFICQ